MKIYIAGKITGDKHYKRKFNLAERALRRKGHSVMNPAWLFDYPEFSHSDYMRITASMQERCDAVLYLSDWQDSNGAKDEYRKAAILGQRKFFDVKDVPKCER